MMLTLTPLTFLKTVLDHFLCASITPYIQCIVTLSQYIFTICLFFLGDCRFYRARAYALLTILSPVTNSAWHIIDKHKKSAKLMKEMNWHKRTGITLLCSTKQRASIILCSQLQELY